MTTTTARRGSCFARVTGAWCSCKEYSNVTGRRFEGWPICTNCKHVEGVHEIVRAAA